MAGFAAGLCHHNRQADHQPLKDELMAELLQILISGLAAGSIYALAAVGFTLLWQASQTINFAQGAFMALAASR